MELQSLAFFIGSTIPFKYTCDDQNISPPLSWDTPPDGTVSFALIVIAAMQGHVLEAVELMGRYARQL